MGVVVVRVLNCIFSASTLIIILLSQLDWAQEGHFMSCNLHFALSMGSLENLRT